MAAIRLTGGMLFGAKWSQNQKAFIERKPDPKYYRPSLMLGMKRDAKVQF